MLQRLLHHGKRNMTSGFTNRLALEKSPYLLQHKHNPIDWYPWGKEAFDFAKKNNRPIFLSVGYSTCHWCHVMEKESFENPAIAKLLNENFVAIKVDREERPDVDKLYMTFVVAVSGHGGWPMSVFLTPDLAPITGGTYFPPDDTQGMMGFASILKLIMSKWEKEQEATGQLGEQILQMIRNQSKSEHGVVKSSDEIVLDMYRHKFKNFDKKHGGFGNAPKFPKPCDLDFLIASAAWYRKSDPERAENCLHMLKVTLDEMSRGGIHDHVGKGFHRYSVDSEWHVPHFEKMLYDQSQLLATYSDFYRLCGKENPEVARTIRDVADYMNDCLSHPDGGFYAAEDADSLPSDGAEKKKEGAFCVWEKKEVEDILSGMKVGSTSAAEAFSVYFDVEENGNVSRRLDPHGELTNKNVLRRLHSDTECADILGISVEDLLPGIELAKQKLLKIRKTRPLPHLDSKMLTAWQGLAITGFVKAFRALSDDSLLERALKCLKFVENNAKDSHGNLIRAVYRSESGQVEKGPESIAAFSDDYAFLIRGLLDVYDVNGDSKIAQKARDLQEKMIEKFWDHENNCGFFLGEENAHEGTSVRLIEDQDNVEPCATSVAAGNLLRLYAIFEDEKLREKAAKCFTSFAERLNKYSFSLPVLAMANRRSQLGEVTIAIVSSENSDFSREVRKIVDNKFIWNASTLQINPDDPLLSGSETHAAMAHGPSPAVYICENFACGLPLKSIEEIRAKVGDL
ncbi:unnamed protein product [Caenorhabditis auriculariae]|uniref:Spermatogenesis-associated protein 20-like TRX domain-containing protein n=1 Tax=Caenorhabditis auriculariae TaxID=2777116 RepID=A0A8S1H972_9PELO|nr:unnamed protein product [Caenorhabditis auriculariae]